MISELEKSKYDTFMGRGPKRILHFEHWSDPDAETYITGIDYYGHPKLCRQKMDAMYPYLELSVPDRDDPVKRPEEIFNGENTKTDMHTVRWGAGESSTWQHGEAFFQTEDDVFSFSPLEHADMREWPHVAESWDYTDQDALLKTFQSNYKDITHAEPNSPSFITIYNTMFMWPLLTFGWEMFMQCCLDERFGRIMDEFADLNRRLFNVFAKLPVNFILCHDDIAITRGPVCSPSWMNRYIYSRYEEFWDIVKAAGKEVLFMTDGNPDEVVDNVMACGARGIISEPYGDYKKIARKYKDCFLAGEGDNRIISANDKNEIDKMVKGMAETGRMCGGYMMCVGNQIPWNVPSEAIKYYLDSCDKYAYR